MAALAVSSQALLAGSSSASCRDTRPASLSTRVTSRRLHLSSRTDIALISHRSIRQRTSPAEAGFARASLMEETGAESAPAPASRPLKVMISGAPASGKGTQCEEIVEKYGLTHISAGDLLRAEVAGETDYGKRVKEFMDAGKLVPDDVVITIVKSRLSQKDAQENGWLLDGYPRSATQAAALQTAGIVPDIFVLLEVPDEILVDRVVGRRLDPVTGKIYHLTFSPPENDEIARRLTQRSDDTEDKVVERLKTHKANVDSVLSSYQDIIFKVDGARSKDAVFADIDKILSNNLPKSEEVRPLATISS